VKVSLLSLLRSPANGSELTLADAPERDREIVAGSLVDASGNRFRIDHGVPLFAEEDSEDETFDLKWRLIGDSYGHTEPSRAIRRQWYLDRFGYETREALLEALAGKLVLDAGSGSGVDSAMFSEADATVVAVDLSRQAAAATYRRLGDRPNVHVLQADVNRLPFPPGLFDYVSSDQVLHHTPDTATALRAIARHLAPGGRIAIYVYRRKGPLREFADDFIRGETTAMSAQECLEFSRAVTELGRALAELRAEIDVPSIPLLGIEGGRQDVQRFVYWNVLKCFWNDGYDFTTNMVVNFDWYHPRFAFRHTPEEVVAWFDDLGLQVERLDVIGSGISAVGRVT